MDTEQIPPEKFVLGEGPYSNWLSLKPQASAEAFEIVPAPMPVAALAAVSLLILGLPSLIAFFLKDVYSNIFIIGIVLSGIITAIATVILIAAQYESRQKRGPTFHFDRKTGIVSLPDRNKSFPTNLHFSFEVLESPFYSPGNSDRENVAELRLVTKDNDIIERFVLATCDTSRRLDTIVSQIHKHVPFPIYIIKHEGFTKRRVVETRYDGKTIDS